jgi:rhodanese-related sulfurtransferase
MRARLLSSSMLLLLASSSSLVLLVAKAFTIERQIVGRSKQTDQAHHGLGLVVQRRGNDSISSHQHEPYLVESDERIQRAFDDPRAVVVDVRSALEITSKIKARRWIHAPGTPTYNERLACEASKLISSANKDTPVIVYCTSGKRAHAAVEVLEKQGYTNVHNAGGIDHLQSFLPIVKVVSSSHGKQAKATILP